MAFEEAVFKLQGAEYMDHKAFDGRLSHPWVLCVCCLRGRSPRSLLALDPGRRYLKKQNLRDFLHVIAPNKTSYELRSAGTDASDR